MDDRIIHLRNRVAASPREAYRHFVGPELLAPWLSEAAEVEPRVGGKYELFWAPADRENNSTMGYLEILALQEAAQIVLTDSGGIQEEPTVLDVPCLTLRDTTEPPITVTEGTNRLVPERTTKAILEAVAAVDGDRGGGGRPEGWDGRTAERCVEMFRRFLGE